MTYSKLEKEQFISRFRDKLKKFAVDVINFCGELPRSASCKIITYQLIKSASSTGANYRAACRERSQKEFFSKLSITVEEADESEYWLELLENSNINCNLTEVKRLQLEIEEIIKVLSKARANTYR